jgi:uncharacterized protein YjbI with pentapeptide repeats
MDMVRDNTIQDRRFYVLHETIKALPKRIKPVNLQAYFPKDYLQENEWRALNEKAFFIDAEGEYYPDYLEANGLIFMAFFFLDYLRKEINIPPETVGNRVGFRTEKGRRVEEYNLFVPPEKDALLKGSERFDNRGFLQSFEIDPIKVRDDEIFRIKGFDHPIITRHLNRLEFAGFECTQVEDFFDYEGWTKSQFEARANCGLLRAAITVFEKDCDRFGERNCLYEFRRVFDHKMIERDMQSGFRSIFQSYNGKQIVAERPGKRGMTFVWSRKKSQVSLGDCQDYFSQRQFPLSCLTETMPFIESMPKELQKAAENILIEAILFGAIKACLMLEQYPEIHSSQRIRLYLSEDEYMGSNPPLINEYKNLDQKRIEATKVLSKVSFSGLDLRDYDFSGKELRETRFERCDLSGADFSGSDLTKSKFVECDLSKAVFKSTILKGVELNGATTRESLFYESDLREAVLVNNELQGISFIKSNLTNARFEQADLNKTFFYRTRLVDAIFKVKRSIRDCVFRLSDLRGAQFTGNADTYANSLTYTDFRNADLSGCCFHVGQVSSCVFTKSRLNNVDFSVCAVLSGCDLQWSRCIGLKLPKEVCDTNFAFVDLSKIQSLHGTTFGGCNFYYANLSGYDFTADGFYLPNNIEYTNLSNCRLEQAFLCSSRLTFPDLTGAKLTNSLLLKQQLEFIKLSPSQERSIQVV